MSEALIIALAELAVKYGPDLAATFAKLWAGKASIDEAIADLDAAAKKSADDYLAEAAKAKSAATP